MGWCPQRQADRKEGDNMSTAPSGWQNPKTNWVPPDVPLAPDFNRIEGNISAIETGTRSLDPAQAPSGNEGSLRQILSWLANRIKAITGKANWYEAPAITLQEASDGINEAKAAATMAQNTADLAVDAGLVVEAALPVEDAEPEQVQTAFGPAVQFAPDKTQAVTFCRRWPFNGRALAMEVVLSASTASGGAFVVQVDWQVNGGTISTVKRTVTPGSTTNLYTADLGQIIPAASLPAGALVTFTLSRLGADEADTHPGNLLIYHCRLKRG